MLFRMLFGMVFLAFSFKPSEIFHFILKVDERLMMI